MNVKQLIDDEDAVSPVIGVILMVAITVILAAVIASFVLGLGEDAASETPTASFTYDFENNNPSSGSEDTLTITHQTGDTLNADRLSLVGSNLAGADTNTYFTGNVSIGTPENTWSAITGQSEVSAGSSLTLSGGNVSVDGTVSDNLNGTDNVAGTTGAGAEDDYLQLENSTVRITWQDSSSGDSATLDTWEGPDA